MNRSLFVVPFALLTPIAIACSSSSSPEAPDSGPKGDSGGTKHQDAGTGTGTGSGSGSGAQGTGTGSGTGTAGTGTGTGIGTSADAGTITVVPAAGSVSIAKGFIDVFGMTDDSHIAYYDAAGGLSVADETGTVTVIAPGPITDGGLGPNFAYTLGNFVFYTANYTTHSVGGNEELLKGDLYAWSAALGTSMKIASNAVGQAWASADSSLIAYLDNAQGTTATYGNLGVVAATSAAITAGGTDILTNILIDESSLTCAPLGEFDKTTFVFSGCNQIDGGNSKPIITAFAVTGSTPYASTVLATGAASTSVTAPVSVNFALDTAGKNALTLGGSPTSQLSIQGLESTAQTKLIAPFGAPTTVSGTTPGFYLSTQSAFAIFTEPSGALGKATFGAPIADGGAPTATLSALAEPDAGGQIYSTLGVSPDENYELDCNTPVQAATDAPTSLNLRKIADGTYTPLVVSGAGLAVPFGGVNSWTADSSYVVFQTALAPTANMTGSVGTLYTAAVATPGTIVQLVTTPLVYISYSLTGTKLIYNQNYVGSLFSDGSTALPNGGASADIYAADASVASQGTLVVAGADSTFYVSTDKTKLFYSFSQLAAADGGSSVVTGDGLYVVAIPQ